ncbi:MAG TPA: TolC family protein [Gallionella sp.]|nr:TolC family protein [Gallionella sp.]
MNRSTSMALPGRIACLLLLAAVCTPALAGTLTLKAALAAADSAHPDLLMAEADRDAAAADLDIANSQQDTRINLEGILRSGRATIGVPDFTSDNSVRLIARKTLYDFGRSSNAEQAAEFELQAREADLTTTLAQRRLYIMARYFDVLLADMQYTVDNELMAVYYVNYDQGKDRLAQGEISSVELAKLESSYQDILLKRNASAQQQRITRAMLANAMNRPGVLPDDLEDPKLPGNQRALPDYQTLLPIMLRNNPRLHAQQELLAASQERISSLRAENGPTLDAEVEAADYSRPATTRNNYSAGLILSWPLYQGNRSDSRVARELARFNKLQAGAEKLKMDLTQALLETCLDITQLQSTAREAARKYTDYRDLQLERSRGLYELELKSNLGTSMSETSDATLRARRNEYQLALSFARLEALLGKPLSDVATTGGNLK